MGRKEGKYINEKKRRLLIFSNKETMNWGVVWAIVI